MHANHGHVFLIEPAPALAYQISSEDTRMLIDIPVDTPGTSAKYSTAPKCPPGGDGPANGLSLIFDFADGRRCLIGGSVACEHRELPNYLRRVTAPQLPPVVRAAFLEALDNSQVHALVSCRSSC